MRLLAITLCLLVLWNHESSAEPGERDPFPSIYAEYFFHNGYRNLKGHRALAIGSYGTYGWSYRASSRSEARSVALKYCRQALHRDFPKEYKKLRCELLAVDGTLVVKDPWVAPDYKVPLQGEDKPLAQGYNILHSDNSLKGIVLSLHGCDGLGWPVYNQVWGEFFAIHGFDFHAPNSFAEPRPAALCGTPDRAPTSGENRLNETRIIKLRVAQTLRTIKILQTRHPGVPLYVWGHSEGGLIVQFIGSKVSGIIVTGEECGISNSMIAADAKTPVLFMFGSDDPFIDGFKKPLTQKSIRRCKNLVRNTSSRTVVITNNAHAYYPWRPEISKAVLEFLKAKVPEPPKPISETDMTLNPRMEADFSRYKSTRKNRTFAISRFGDFGWTSGWDYLRDAEYYALYLCTKSARLNYFRLKTQYCSIIDRNGIGRSKTN